MVLLQLSNLSLSVGSALLVEGVNALLTQGQRVALVGANGSGKSTLLRALSRPFDTEYYLVGAGSITGTLSTSSRGAGEEDAEDVLLVEQDLLQVHSPALLPEMIACGLVSATLACDCACLFPDWCAVDETLGLASKG
mmetsp:Transcript_5232/g.12135  ORF Transcript_5232/g.12135 Transcript_5232/m.12135 type:complete len:138 (+) Transcript_5232:89-502(+)